MPVSLKQKEIKKRIKSLLARQSQDGSAFVGTFPRLLRHRMIRGSTLEAQGEGLKILLTLEKGTGRH